MLASGVQHLEMYAHRETETRPCVFFVEATRAPADIRELYAIGFRAVYSDGQDAMVAESEEGIRYQGLTAVLTYNGPWGVLPRSQENPVNRVLPWRELVKEVRILDAAREVWRDFLEHVKSLARSWRNTYGRCLARFA